MRRVIPHTNRRTTLRYGAVVGRGASRLSRLSTILLLPAASCLEASEISYDRDIRPIFSEHCFHCHGPDAGDRKAGLRLDTREGATRKLKSGGVAIVSSEPAKSILWKRISSSDPDDVMPPADTGKSLTPAQIETLRNWIAEGAEYEAHWAFEPIENPSPPPSENHGDSAIDRFLQAALEEAGLAYSPPVSRAKLIRRVTFDLTGLPPTWQAVEDFVHDRDPKAFVRVVDRLLQSPAYGERWGRHWLDLARYADTHGGSAIGFTRFAFSYTYRDYVIRAFNEDLPYDRFLREQLAADQLGLDANDPALAALGFLTVGRQFRNRHDQLDDQIDVITRGLLGLTVSCARCHDHKFDPIPTADYYALHATLASSRVPSELPLVGTPDVSPEYQAELVRRQRLREDLVREQGDVMRSRLRMQVGPYLRELAREVPEQDTATTFLSYRTEDLRPVVLERWRRYVQDRDETDPVFGPWHQLASLKALSPTDFQARSRDLINRLRQENGDPKSFQDEHRLATKPPKWNPRVLDAFQMAEPTSFVEVAEVYGKVFADVQRRWMNSLLAAAEEAAPQGELIPDQDRRHAIVNSSIERQLRHHLYDPGSPTSLTFHDDFHLKMLNRGVRDPVRGTLGAIHQLNLSAKAPPRSRLLHERVEDNGESYVFLRGNPVARGEPVEPRFLSALSSSLSSRFPDGARRLGLAEAIVHPDNPLTRRVLVNWVWQHHFGKGLVRTPDDFGTRGEPPSHPELLDYLATKLLDDQWSLKKLHRRILLSKAYQQDSRERPEARRIDSQNDLLWKMPVRKLGLEAMRDSLLAVSGRLDPTPGGQPFEEKNGKLIPRRSIYAFVNRDVIARMTSTFDGADPSACTVKRPETMVPQQTLFALNSDLIQNLASALTQRPEIQSVSIPEERIRRLYQHVYSRKPQPEELALAKEFLTSPEAGPNAWTAFVHALLASNEFHFVD